MTAENKFFEPQIGFLAWDLGKSFQNEMYHKKLETDRYSYEKKYSVYIWINLETGPKVRAAYVPEMGIKSNVVQLTNEML